MLSMFKNLTLSNYRLFVHDGDSVSPKSPSHISIIEIW